MTGDNNIPEVIMKYDINGKVLGKGSYGIVKEAIKLDTGEKFAVKQISKGIMIGQARMILNEITTLKKISRGHPNILTLYDCIETPTNLYLIVDFCEGGELFDRICEVDSFFEGDACNIIQSVCDGVHYLHNMNIIHRDLKNILFLNKLPDSPLLLADFGISKIMYSDQLNNTVCGTPAYMAPEVIHKLGHGKSVDLWAIGVVAFLLLSGYLPFESQSSVIEIENIVKGVYSYDDPSWNDISSEAKDFISKLLLVDL